MQSSSRLKQKDKDIFFEKAFDSNSRMNKTETIALYKYLHSLEPAKRKVGKIVFSPGEDIPY